jgi:hypothetical protein
MKTLRSTPLLLVLLVPVMVHAGDLPVGYRADFRAFRTGAVAATPLTFTLYADPACTTAVASQVVSAGAVGVIEKPKTVAPRGAPRVPATVRLVTTLPGVTAGGNLYLQVTGAGIAPVGGACQAQAAVDQGSLATLPGVTIAPFGPNGPFSSQWIVESDPSTQIAAGQGIAALDRQAAAALGALDPSRRHTCDLETLDPPPASGNAAAVYGVHGCTALAPTCTDGLTNGDESDVDCGGTQCAPCPGSRTCGAGSDCLSQVCVSGICANCTTANAACGGVCPACVDFETCDAPSDCASGHCQAPTPTACAAAFGSPICIPAHCFDGVKNGGEVDLDCGQACRIGCAQGKACACDFPSGFLNHCDCASHACSANFCSVATNTSTCN